MDATYFPLSEIPSGEYAETVVSLEGFVGEVSILDGPPFFSFTLDTGDGMTLSVQGPPEGVLIRTAKLALQRDFDMV